MRFAMMPSGASVCVALLWACLCSQVFGNKFTCFCYVRKLSQDCTGLMWLSSLSFFAVVEIKIYKKWEQSSYAVASVWVCIKLQWVQEERTDVCVFLLSV